jgi:hypothetical protein
MRPMFRLRKPVKIEMRYGSMLAKISSKKCSESRNAKKKSSACENAIHAIETKALKRKYRRAWHVKRENEM